MRMAGIRQILGRGAVALALIAGVTGIVSQAATANPVTNFFVKKFRP